MAKGQKKVDQWSITHDGRTVVVDVYMIRSTEGSIYGGATFRAECKELDEMVQDPNIEQLQIKITTRLRELLSLEYQAFFEIEVGGFSNTDSWLLRGGPGRFGTERGSADIKIQRILVSTSTNKMGRRMYKNSEDGRPQEYYRDLGKLHGHGPNARALVPDKPEYRAGLLRILVAFADLNEQLQKLCDAGEVESNLLKLGLGDTKLLTGGNSVQDI